MRALFLLVVIAAGLVGASYAGARFTAGRLMGPDANQMASPTARFAFAGIQTLRAKPRGWILSYPSATEFGPHGAEIYVSPVGRLLGTRPADLARRVEARQAAEP
ncbi:MAG TPA: hypothetical protein VGN76_12235 [Gemmatimonadales bacterium]|jgi:hypothetical protein|nr:hypothetical protein [Gemmatimonadales bacterium]